MKTNNCITSAFFGLFLFLGILSGNALLAQSNDTATLPEFTVDVSKTMGGFKPLNGVNGGPRIRLGNAFDNSEYFKTFGPPHVRLHDTRYSDEETVDIHTIFPNFDADENDPANYHFQKTDLYIKSILDLGAKVIFRLGESIEHGEPKFYIHPPADFEKWARICSRIVQHYNMGWAEGFHWDIQYWEIWNEPDIADCWSGTQEQYLQLYEITAKTLKKLDANLKVGGPTIAFNMDSELGEAFLKHCKNTNSPLDFVSYHIYSKSTDDFMKRIEISNATIRKHGFKDVEISLSEWNYIPYWPDGKNREASRDVFAQTTGATGSAFTVSVLSYMQDTELDMAQYYSAFGTIFRIGLFDESGIPKKAIHALEAYHKMVQLGTRVSTSGNNQETGVSIIASTDLGEGKTAVLISTFDDDVSRYKLQIKNVPFKNELKCSEYVLDDTHNLDLDREQILSSKDFSLIVDLPKSTVRLLLFEAL